MHSHYPPKVSESDQIILFDGVCRLCNAWSRFIIRFDRKQLFKLCSMQSDSGRAIMAWFGYPDGYAETMLLVQGNKVLGKSEAFITVMGQLPFPWRLVRAIKIIPAGIRDWLYDRIAGHRYRIFGKYDTCPLPTPEQRNRFL